MAVLVQVTGVLGESLKYQKLLAKGKTPEAAMVEAINYYGWRAFAKLMSNIPIRSFQLRGDIRFERATLGHPIAEVTLRDGAHKRSVSTRKSKLASRSGRHRSSKGADNLLSNATLAFLLEKGGISPGQTHRTVRVKNQEWASMSARKRLNAQQARKELNNIRKRARQTQKTIKKRHDELTKERKELAAAVNFAPELLKKSMYRELDKLVFTKRRVVRGIQAKEKLAESLKAKKQEWAEEREKARKAEYTKKSNARAAKKPETERLRQEHERTGVLRKETLPKPGEKTAKQKAEDQAKADAARAEKKKRKTYKNREELKPYHGLRKHIRADKALVSEMGNFDAVKRRVELEHRNAHETSLQELAHHDRVMAKAVKRRARVDDILKNAEEEFLTRQHQDFLYTKGDRDLQAAGFTPKYERKALTDHQQTHGYWKRSRSSAPTRPFSYVRFGKGDPTAGWYSDAEKYLQSKIVIHFQMDPEGAITFKAPALKE